MVGGKTLSNKPVEKQIGTLAATLVDAECMHTERTHMTTRASAHTRLLDVTTNTSECVSVRENGQGIAAKTADTGAHRFV
jgi:hypothetical protein